MRPKEQIVERLQRVLSRSDTVILVGSGISLWSNLPTWVRLVSDLASFLDHRGLDGDAVRREIHNNDLLLAASYGVFQLDKRDFGEFIREACRFREAQPADVHHKLVRLGPTCFVTTNYDPLIEEALQAYRPDDRPRVVTNRQTIEIGDIVTADARNFVFKYHGDLLDVESIILTREQYRELTGKYRNVIEALRTLLTTRPILMVGFGLRDPDFLSVKDTITTAFMDHVGEHYAIMPDFDDFQCEYWRRSYNINVLTYTTHDKADGKGRDHRELLDLLDQLLPKPDTMVSHEPSTDERLFYLARLAARMEQLRPAVDLDLPLTVKRDRSKFEHQTADVLYEGQRLTTLIRNYPRSFLLTGRPGAGKSFALRTYASEAARSLRHACLEGEPDLDMPVVLYADLATFAGDLRLLLSQLLPSGLSLTSLLASRSGTLLLDSANEMPRDYIETGSWQSDFTDLFAETEGWRVIVGSRDEDWLASMSLPQFQISDIAHDFCVEYLKKRYARDFSGNFELLQTLSRPLFFALADKGRIGLDEARVPKDVYRAFFAHLAESWAQTHAAPIDFVTLLSPVCFVMADGGREHFDASEIEDAWSQQLEAGLTREVIDFLVAEGLLLVLRDRRLMLFHQSASEFLAAVELASRYQNDRITLTECLHHRRWDYTLFLSMSLLPAEERRAFFDQMLHTDVLSALRAVHFVEENQEEFIEEILTFILEIVRNKSMEIDVTFQVSYALHRLPIVERHIPQLEGLAATKGEIGGTAAGFVALMVADKRKNLIEKAIANPDYNYVQALVSGCRAVTNAEEVRWLMTQLSEELDDDGYHPFGKLLHSIEPQIAQDIVLENIDKQGAVLGVLRAALQGWDAPFARERLKDLVKNGDRESVASYYLNICFHSESLETEETAIDTDLCDVLINLCGDTDGEWAVRTLAQLVARNSKWQRLIDKRMEHMRPAGKLALKIALTTDKNQIVALMENFLEHFPSDLTNAEASVIAGLNEWRDASYDLILSSVLTRNPFLTGGVGNYLVDVPELR